MSKAAVSIEPRAWELVLSRIEADLLSGQLTPGDHLPPERQLAADLGVGRSSVREAVRVLEVLGLVRTGTGSGPNAGAIIIATPSGGMSALMRLQVAANGFAVADVVRTRLILESAVAVELAESAPGELPVARQLLDAMDDPDLSPAEFLALDAGVPRASPTPPATRSSSATMAGLRSAIEGYVVAGLPRIKDWDATSTTPSRRAPRHPARHRSRIRAFDPGLDPRPHHRLLHRSPRRHNMVKRQFPNPVELAELMKFKKPTSTASAAG